MGSRQRWNSYWTLGLVWAGVVMFVLLDYTPAYNFAYTYTDSKGTIHIKNIPRQTPPGKGQSPVSLATPASYDESGVTPTRVSRAMDKKGIFHISNAVSSPEVKPHPAQQTQPIRQARKRRDPKAAVITQQAKSSQVLPTGGRQDCRDGQVNTNTTDSPGAGAQVANQPAPVGGDDGVSRMALFIDQQGKMFIYQTKVEATDSPGSDNKMLTRTAAADLDGLTAVAVQPASLVAPVSAQSNLEPGGRPRQAAKRSKVLPTGRIQVFRDGQGYTHIVNSPGVGSQFATEGLPQPEMPQIAASGESTQPRQNVSAALAPPETYQNNLRHPVGLDTSFSRVAVFKDKQGKLNICNPKVKAPDYPWLALDTRKFTGKAGDDLEVLMAVAAQQNRLPLPLVKAVIRAESGFAPGAVSCKGAMGLMQLMPTTATFLGVKNPFCPQENVMAGCRYLRNLLDNLNGSVALALAAYNAGLQRVINSGYQVPAIAETQDFVDKVVRYFLGYQQQASASPKI